MPPKVARRKKQPKEQQLHSEVAVSRKADAGDEDDYDDDEETAQEMEKPVTSTSRVSKSSAAGLAAVNNSCDKASSSLPPEDDRVWVQCNTCDKWRALPSTVDPALLPDIWFCELNIYDLARNCCEAAEESYSEGTDEPLKTFLKLWTKKLRTADKAETRLSSSAVTRGRKKRSEVEWIRCCSPSCGKWRAVVRTVDPVHMLNRLSKGSKWGSKGMKWYCSMNSWDETQASCASPQEQLYDCRWNIGGGGGGINGTSKSVVENVQQSGPPSVLSGAVIVRPTVR